MKLPPCGIYRTTEQIGSVPAGRLVYFHNHGDPGPGIYLPAMWSANRAVFSEEGQTLANERLASTLEPLLHEGLYRVSESFACCPKNCVAYESDQLVQLGYNGTGEAILFVPEWHETGLAFPEIGHVVDDTRLARMSRLVVAESPDTPPEDPGALN